MCCLQTESQDTLLSDADMHVVKGFSWGQSRGLRVFYVYTIGLICKKLMLHKMGTCWCFQRDLSLTLTKWFSSLTKLMLHINFALRCQSPVLFMSKHPPPPHDLHNIKPSHFLIGGGGEKSCQHNPGSNFISSKTLFGKSKLVKYIKSTL